MTVGVLNQSGSELDRLDFPPIMLHYTHAHSYGFTPTPGNTMVLYALIDAIGPADANEGRISVPAGWTARVNKGSEAAGTTGTAILIATRVVCPGDPTSVTIQGEWVGHYASGAMPFGHSLVAVFEVNGGWGGATSMVPSASAASHSAIPNITPTAGLEAFIMSFAANENAYGRSGGPGGGYSADQLSLTANDGSSVTLHVDTLHTGSASGSYNPGTMTYAVGGAWTNFFNGGQIWFKAALDGAACLGPNCVFSASPTTAIVGHPVVFTDASTNSPLTWAWDFGDGNTSTTQNPTHIYTSPGTYTVSLTVTNLADDCTETKTDYITVLPPGFTEEVHEILPPGDDYHFVGNLSDAYNRVIRPVKNEPGTGQFTINRHSPNATAVIVQPGNLVRVTIPEIDTDSIFGYFMEQGDFTLVSENEEGGEEITIAGRGMLSYWDRAVWLSEKFIIPWWDVAWGTPPSGARGHVTFKSGTYRRYTVSGGNITGYVNFTTAGFEAYFDSRQTYPWPSENSKRFLVHIMAGETNAGWYVHPHQDGVTETLPSQTVGTTTSVLLSDISPDTPGAILYHMYMEAQDPARPVHPIPLMGIDFTATTDSNGDPWATTDALAGITAELGETYLDTIMKLVATGVIDVEMGPDFDMHAYNAPHGRDLTGSFGAGKVRFEKGVNIASELKREREDNPVATFAEVVGADNVTAQVELPDAASRVAREIATSGESQDISTLEALGLAELNVRLEKSDAIVFQAATGNNEATGRYYPGPQGTDNGKYWLGDFTTLHTGTGEQDFDEAVEIVAAVTITEDDGANMNVLPELGSTIGEAERKLFRIRQKIEKASAISDSADSGSPTGETAHPDLAVHDALGLATDTELAAAVGVPTVPITARYTFSTTTTDADPGAGNLRLSNASQYLAVTVRADLTDSDGADVTALLDVIAANPTGYLRLQKRDDPTKWLVATVSASASPSGYRNITIANIAKSANSPFANGDKILMSFIPGADLSSHLSDTVDAHDASAVSVADAGGFYTSTDVEGALQEAAAFGGGGAGGGGFLDAAAYVGANVVQTSATPAAVNAGLAVTFVAPPSGKVVVTLAALMSFASGFNFYWLVLEGSTNVSETMLWSAGSSAHHSYVTAELLITGLTPGSSHTYKFAQRTNGGGSMTLDPGQTPAIIAVAAVGPLSEQKRSVEFVIDGGGAAITAGVKGDIEMPFSWTDITSVRVLGDTSGTIAVSIWKDTYANYPPTVADKISASAPASLSSAAKSEDITLTGWTKTGTVGDILRFNVDALATSVTRVTISLMFTV